MLQRICKSIIYRMPSSLRDRFIFRLTFGRFPRLKSPKTFNEKVLFRKTHACITDPVYSVLADKYSVRNYVASKIGSEYLIELIDETESISELRKILKGKKDFVIKPNHAAGMVEICDSVLSENDVIKLSNKANDWLKVDYSKIVREHHYTKINRKILIEKRIGNKGDILTDYKLHLFRKKNNEWFYVLQIIDDRFSGELARTFYVNNLDVVYSGVHTLNPEYKIQIVKQIELSKILLDDLEYARIDWYLHNGKLYFGEITLTPAAGLGTGYGTELDELMGEQWDLTLAPR